MLVLNSLYILFLLMLRVFTFPAFLFTLNSCSKKSKQEETKEIVYNYKQYTYKGQTNAHYTSLETQITTN